MESGSKYDVDILRRIEDTTLNDQELARQLNLIDDYEMKNSDIRTYFSGKVIFMTGATGFMGKTLLEKLLRTCSELEKVYVLIRSKKNKSPMERMEEVFSNPLYNELQKSQPNFRSKVHLIVGNMSFENMGVSKQDLELLQKEVTNIFHLAATVKFDEPMQVAVDINIKGTLEILKFAKNCEKLETIIHVSTAFSNCHLSHIEERLYPPPMKAETIIGLVDSLEEKQLTKITPEILGGWPNTYTFTKSISEDVVADHVGLPIAIFRPSIVLATNREPLSGWTDNVYGPSGVVIGVGLGFLRAMCVDDEKVTDLIPVDYAIAALIACAWKQSKLKPAAKREDIPIYNYVSGADNPIKWGEYAKWNLEYGYKIPTIHAIWPISYLSTANPTLFFILEFFLHTIPGKLVDFYCHLVGKPERASKIMDKIGKTIRALMFFSLREFTFKNFNIRYLWNELNEADKQLFKFDIKDIDWPTYFSNHVMGLRVYVLKDPSSTLPEARIRWKRLCMYDRALKGFLFLILISFLWFICKLMCSLFK